MGKAQYFGKFHPHMKTLRSGGRAGRLAPEGGVRLACDQLAQDKSVNALMNNHRTGTPLVLLADDRYPLFPYDLGKQGIGYVVLGWFVITNTWGTLIVLDLGYCLILRPTR
jgi:hypothetical protein